MFKREIITVLKQTRETIMTYQVIIDRHNSQCVLGTPTKITSEWLAMQTIPFKEGAVLHSAYPITGGACVVDINDVQYVDKLTPEEIQKILEYNPAADMVRSIIF